MKNSKVMMVAAIPMSERTTPAIVAPSNTVRSGPEGRQS